MGDQPALPRVLPLAAEPVQARRLPRLPQSRMIPDQGMQKENEAMKFLTLADGQLGAVLDQQVVAVVEAATALGQTAVATTLLQLVAQDDAAAQQVWQLAQRAAQQNVACYALGEVTILAPLPEPRRNVICVGKNYREHAREIARKVDNAVEVPERPIFFTKATTAVIGPGAVIPSHADITQKLDYEAELAVIIGRGGRDIPRAQAMQHIFGYTAFNDVSARDLQGAHLQWYRGKSLDGFAPMGPMVVHRSAMPPAAEIEVQCQVNGELRQKASLAEMIFDIPTLIETLSAGATLLPGDIIATGTPAGVGMGFTPARYLQAGDEVVIEVTGAGRLVNRVA
jgi:2-keto-4-pentenoate hydratase/2-oxohepta-3-ene-1,7-dioic acid hydratase in catechol pathway